MEDFEYFWTPQESIHSIDDLKLKLQYTNHELELTRKQTNEELRKSNERIKKLLQLLQTTCRERDEAKDQLKKFQQIMGSNDQKPNNFFNDHIIPTTAPFSPDSPLLTTNYPTKTNSNITESSSFSFENNNNNNNDGKNPNFHALSPDSSNVGKSVIPMKVVDQETLIISNMAKGRTLPTKGKLLQAVMEAGPLLSTLMVAGSLPQWRNPPGVLTHQIPPVNLKGCISDGSGVDPGSGQSVGIMSHNKEIFMPSISTSTNSLMYNNGHCQNSMLDFGSGSFFSGGRMMMNSGLGFDCQIPKRQRII